ncbi:LOW QUALITY PROTEIN: hypothetical protein U9M48_036302 [Paspalum notatum var. saurae]|uniref:Uncharacterized protein n=1 Tax=Paspalum notatum var. saurae TaxID=547442 RepID=A0AAQ3UH82_PASNO
MRRRRKRRRDPALESARRRRGPARLSAPVRPHNSPAPTPSLLGGSPPRLAPVSYLQVPPPSVRGFNGSAPQLLPPCSRPAGRLYHSSLQASTSTRHPGAQEPGGRRPGPSSPAAGPQHHNCRWQQPCTLHSKPLGLGSSRRSSDLRRCLHWISDIRSLKPSFVTYPLVFSSRQFLVRGSALLAFFYSHLIKDAQLKQKLTARQSKLNTARRKNGLATKVEKSRKQMKEHKNRAKEIRGVKKTIRAYGSYGELIRTLPNAELNARVPSGVFARALTRFVVVQETKLRILVHCGSRIYSGWVLFLYIRSKHLDYGVKLSRVSLLCDNESTVKLADNPVQHSRTKHIDVCHHFIKDHVAKGDIILRNVETKERLADIFTKPLDKSTFCRL